MNISDDLSLAHIAPACVLVTAYTRLTLHYHPRISVFTYERDAFFAEAIKKVLIFLQDFFDRFGPFQ